MFPGPCPAFHQQRYGRQDGAVGWWPGNEAKFAKALTQYESPEVKTVLFVIIPDNHIGD